MIERRAIIGTRIDTKSIIVKAPCGCQNDHKIEKYFTFCPYCGDKLDKSVKEFCSKIEKEYSHILDAYSLRVFSNEQYIYIGRYISNTYTSIHRINTSTIKSYILDIFNHEGIKDEVDVGLYMDDFGVDEESNGY